MNLKSNAGPITAVVLLVGTILWVVLGGNEVIHAKTTDTNIDTITFPSKIATEKVIKKQVQAQTINEQTMSDSLSLSGTTQPSKSIDLTSGIAGRIQKIYVKKGDYVQKDATIMLMDTRTLKAQIAEQEAIVKLRKMELNGTVQLKKENYSSAVNEASAQSALATAEANLKELQINLENSRLVAPFSGVLNSLDVEEGQLIPSTQFVGQLVSINPLTIEINVPQKSITRIKENLPATISLTTGQEAKGKVKYISSIADSATRSISIEIEVENNKNEILAGLTAYVQLILPDHKAHSFSASLLTLDDNGKTAVKLVGLDNKVIVAPVEVLRSERDQVWVSGLPKSANLITVGQGFTKAGDVVDALYQDR